MLMCKDCKDDICPEAGVDMPACDDFHGGEEKPLWLGPEEERAIHDLFRAVSALDARLGTMERRWEKMLAAIVREANE